MKQIIAALLFVSFFSISAQAEVQQVNVYATEACHSGCFVVNTPGVIYYGAAAKSYRVCTQDGFVAKLNVNNQNITVPATSFNVRGCVDVNGTYIALEGGVVAAGINP